MTSKSALETIKNIGLHHLAYYDDDDNYGDDDSIDSYEEYDGTIEENYHDAIRTIEKSLEVLELIKEKVVNVIRLKYVVCTEETEEDSLKYYNSLIIQRNKLTKEEYRFLKEWLNETNT